MEVSRDRQGRRSRRLYAWQQPARDGLDGGDGGHFHRLASWARASGHRFDSTMLQRVLTRLRLSRSSFSGTSITPAKTECFGTTDPKLIDDGALNFVGLDETDPNAKDDSVITALAIPVNRPVELVLRSRDVIHNFWVPHFDSNRTSCREWRSKSTSPLRR